MAVDIEVVKKLQKKTQQDCNFWYDCIVIFYFILQLFEIGRSAHVGRLSILGQRCPSPDPYCHDDNYVSQDL